MTNVFLAGYGRSYLSKLPLESSRIGPGGDGVRRRALLTPAIDLRALRGVVGE